jgi:hypothetical protein
MNNPDHLKDVNRINSLKDLNLSKSFTVSDIPNNNKIIQANFTTQSNGILCNTKDGGLRKDLTRGLDDEYYDKLHEVPVFGFNELNQRERMTEEDNKPAPIGDQWKFFRDFYNFYKNTDDGLADSISDENVFLGLDDVTSPNPKTPMRITNKDVAKHINYLYPSQSFMRGRTETTYNNIITPRIARSVHRQPQSTSKDDAWYLFTPAVRPVVLRTTFKIGMKSTRDSLTGKYVLQFELFPTMVIWNPFNVSIDLSRQDINNPMCIGNTLETHIHGNDRFVISVNNGEKFYAIRNGTWAPRVIALYEDILAESSMPNEMPPGEVWVLGLNKSYSANIVPIYSGSATLYPPSIDNPVDLNNYTGGKLAVSSYGNEVTNLTPQTGYGKNNSNLFPLYLANQSNNVSENNSIIYTCRQLMTHDKVALLSGYKTVGRGARTRYIPQYTQSAVWEDALFDATDTIEILSFNKTTKNIQQRITGEYDWTGKLTRSPDSSIVEAFHHYENADLRVPSYSENIDIAIGQVGALASGNSFPFYHIDFVARSSGDENESDIDNAAFPAFANVNFLGTQPLVVTSRDATGDIKSLYIPHKVAKNHALEALPPRDNDTGKGYFGESFNSTDKSSDRITLYDIPRHPIISIADFKNLTFNWFEDSPARPIGASWPNATLRNLDDTFIPVRSGTFTSGAGCDVSYHYNNRLFDEYFFSGLSIDEKYKDNVFPYGEIIDQQYLNEGKPIGNTRLVAIDKPNLEKIFSTNEEGNYTAFEKTASHFFIDGAFNVNSTSNYAWQSVLSGFRNKDLTGVNEDYTEKKIYSGEGSPFVDNYIPSGKEDNLFNGYRRISDEEIASLSLSITDVIRNRGVAKSLGEFINRNPYSLNLNEQKQGRIDEAINLSNINKDKHKIATTTQNQSDVQALSSGPDQAQVSAGNLAPYTGAGLPGYFKQQDILRPLSPIMTTRGDTFIIRAYGSSNNNFSDDEGIKVICEATLQRFPDYVENIDEPYTDQVSSNINAQFGRKFKIISFKWITLDDV